MFRLLGKRGLFRWRTSWTTYAVRRASSWVVSGPVGRQTRAGADILGAAQEVGVGRERVLKGRVTGSAGDGTPGEECAPRRHHVPARPSISILPPARRAQKV